MMIKMAMLLSLVSFFALAWHWPRPNARTTQDELA
jgi:hypothetical protein